MKKIDEILAFHAGMLLERMVEQPNRILITPKEASSAMQEYAEQESEREAVAFSEFLKLPEYRNEYENELLTTTELYKIFKQQNDNNGK